MGKGRGWVLGYTLTIFGALALCQFGSTAVTTISQQMAMPRQHTIVIDPGHGGVDGGATSCTGRLESSYNLEIGLKLRDVLHLLGYGTKMTRVIDESVYTEGDTIAQQKRSDLKQRVKLVENTPAPILISIHQNRFEDPKYRGAQVFYSDTPGSKALAQKLQRLLAATLKPSTGRREKEIQGIYLMDHISCTGILLECGFLSNMEEERRLADPVYQRQLCCTVAAALCQFLG